MRILLACKLNMGREPDPQPKKETAIMKLTTKQIQALDDISRGQAGAQFAAIQPNTRRSLFRLGLIEKDWNHRYAMGNIEYLRLTKKGVEAAGQALCWEGF